MFMYPFVYGIMREKERTFYYKGNLYTVNLIPKVENAVNILTYDQCYAFKNGICSLPKENIFIHSNI